MGWMGIQSIFSLSWLSPNIKLQRCVSLSCWCHGDAAHIMIKLWLNHSIFIIFYHHDDHKCRCYGDSDQQCVKRYCKDWSKSGEHFVDCLSTVSFTFCTLHKLEQNWTLCGFSWVLCLLHFAQVGSKLNLLWITAVSYCSVLYVLWVKLAVQSNKHWVFDDIPNEVYTQGAEFVLSEKSSIYFQPNIGHCFCKALNISITCIC